MPVTATAQRSHLENEVKACREQLTRLKASVVREKREGGLKTPNRSVLIATVGWLQEKKRQELGIQVCRLEKLTYNPTLSPVLLTPTERKRKHKGDGGAVWKK